MPGPYCPECTIVLSCSDSCIVLVHRLSVLHSSVQHIPELPLVNDFKSKLVRVSSMQAPQSEVPLLSGQHGCHYVGNMTLCFFLTILPLFPLATQSSPNSTGVSEVGSTPLGV